MTPANRHARLLLLIVFTVSCGSASTLSVDGSTDKGGISGSGGSAASGGVGGASGEAGSAGASVAGRGGGGSIGMAGSGGAGATGTAGVGGASGTGGHAGVGGAPGVGGHGGAGGSSASACGFVATVDRSCTVDADCVAVTHTTNCCGSALWLGIRASEQQRFSSLESACDRTYPACGCAAGSPRADDGSIVSFGTTAGVSCQAGTCKTFSKACGHPCDAGRSCTTCKGTDGGATSFCTLQCTNDTMCTEPNRSQCHFIFTTGICVESFTACSGF